MWSPATCGGNPDLPVAQPTPTPTPAPEEPAPGGECDPSYPDICVPSPPPDLDCGDIPEYHDFRVRQPDPHGFDGRDNDGIGCEGNG